MPCPSVSMMNPNLRKLNTLGRLILTAGIEGNYTDLELLVVITLMQNAILDHAEDPALRVLVQAILGTENEGVRWAYLKDFEALVCGEPLFRVQ
jgi:hypothetical protein